MPATSISLLIVVGNSQKQQKPCNKIHKVLGRIVAPNSITENASSIAQEQCRLDPPCACVRIRRNRLIPSPFSTPYHLQTSPFVPTIAPHRTTFIPWRKSESRLHSSRSPAPPRGGFPLQDPMRHATYRSRATLSTVGSRVGDLLETDVSCNRDIRQPGM